MNLGTFLSINSGVILVTVINYYVDYQFKMERFNLKIPWYIYNGGV